MKKRFFYLADIDTTFTVAPMTKKEIISIGQELKQLCEFMSHDQTISGYTKAGEFFYYDYSNFDSFKKSDIINAVSVIYSDESGDYYWGGFDINEWGVANPTEDGTIIIANHENIKEIENANKTETAEDQTTEDQTAEVQAAEESKNYYAETYNFGFIAHNSEYGAPSLLIFSSKEDREKYINKYDIYRGDVNKRVIAITAKEARKYYERTRDGVRGWKDGTEYIKHIRDNIYYSVETGNYGRTSEEFTL